MSGATEQSRARRRTVEAYSPPAVTGPIDLRLDANEGPAIPREALAALLARGVEGVRRYPDPRELEAALADRLGIATARVVLTAGGDDAIDRVCRAFVEPGGIAVATTPTFEMIPRAMRAAGAAVVEIPWLSGSPPIKDMLREVRGGAGLAALVTPNNPTGAAASAADVERLLAGSPVPVMIDLAYTEYADEDLTARVLGAANGVAVRTLSKAWGLAGLRIGYVVAADALAARVRAQANPYPVSGPAIAMATAWLREGAGFVRAHVERVRGERAELASVLEGLGARPLDSGANFVAARFEDAWAMADALARHGIAVRRFRPGSGFAEYLRITCPGNERDFERLREALGRAAAEVRP